jgi:hypothetical protein
VTSHDKTAPSGAVLLVPWLAQAMKHFGAICTIMEKGEKICPTMVRHRLQCGDNARLLGLRGRGILFAHEVYQKTVSKAGAVP